MMRVGCHRLIALLRPRGATGTPLTVIRVPSATVCDGWGAVVFAANHDSKYQHQIRTVLIQDRASPPATASLAPDPKKPGAHPRQSLEGDDRVSRGFWRQSRLPGDGGRISWPQRKGARFEATGPAQRQSTCFRRTASAGADAPKRVPG